jgi:phosphoserine phosphatase
LDSIRLVVFDMDGVLVDAHSSWVLVHQHYGTQNEDSLRAFLKDEIDDYEFIRRDVDRWRAAGGDIKLEDVMGVLDEAPLVPGAVETLLELHDRGLVTAIVSGGLRYLAERVGQLGNVTVVHANDFEVDDMGYLTGGGVVKVPLKDKASVVRAVQEMFGIAASGTAVVGDTLVDVSMFALAQVAIAFNPMDRQTEAAATHVVKSRDLRSILPVLLGDEGLEWTG